MRAKFLGRLLLSISVVIAGFVPTLVQDRLLAQDSDEDLGDLPVETAPVVIDGRELFRVRGVTVIPAASRAEAIAQRIRELAGNASFDPETLEVITDEHLSLIGAPGNPILRIVEADAAVVGVDRRTLGDLVLARIRESITAYRAARTREALVSSSWRFGAATLIAALAFLLVWRVFRRWTRWAERRLEARVKAVTISSFEVVRVDRIWRLLHGSLRVLRGLAAIVVGFLYLHYSLGLFPWTRAAAGQIDDWVIAPLKVLGLGLVSQIPNLIFLFALFIVVRWALKLLQLFFAAVKRGEVDLTGFEKDWADPTFKLVRLAVVAFALIVAYPYIPGSSTNAFKGISLFLGVILSLGSSSFISNIIAGYTMVYRRAFHEGDFVQIGAVRGIVTHIRLQVTHLRTVKNEEVVVPNSTILSTEVVNYSSLAAKAELILHTTVGIGYETPWRQVEGMLLASADRTPGLLKEPKPFVLQTALGDFAVTYEINGYCNEPLKMPEIYSDLHRNILDVFNEYGVQIMTPAYIADPAEPKLVPRDKWHLPPAKQS